MIIHNLNQQNLCNSGKTQRKRWKNWEKKYFLQGEGKDHLLPIGLQSTCQFVTQIVSKMVENLLSLLFNSISLFSNSFSSLKKL
jgi:hypothetical protein